MKKVLFISQEIIPFVPETILSEAGKELPNLMIEAGCEIRTFMPKWGTINERRGQLHEVIRLSGQNVVIDDIDHPTLIKVASIPNTKIQVYFIDNEDYFTKRTMALDEDGNPCPDNAERAIFYARAVVETLKKLRWTPDVIHCQGWMSAFVPFYIKKAYNDEPTVANAKVVTSLYENGSDAPVNDANVKQHMEYRNITADSITEFGDTFTGKELMELAIKYSDAVITATPEIDAATIDTIRNSGVAFMEANAETSGETYTAFYESLFNE